MKIDFGKHFHENQVSKIKYKVRFDNNLLHDLSYLNSYVHDSKLNLSTIRLNKKRLVIPIARNCWELYKAKDELLVANSSLVFYPVKNCRVSSSHIIFQKLDNLKHICISDIFLSDSYYRNKDEFEFKIINKFLGFELSIQLLNIKNEPTIYLADLNLPDK